ncbi:MAG: hypothetical protein ACI93R_003822 [Flavobacteriales bacterium]|jgi:hypothetical protein
MRRMLSNIASSNICSASVLVIITLLMMVSACSHKTIKASQAQITVSLESPARIRFSGKGAGAGMMLSGSMGSMGIAIGIAIDEGIAKDIEAAAQTVDFSMATLVKYIFTDVADGRFSSAHVVVERYGFKIRRGELVEPDIRIRVDVGEFVCRISSGAVVEAVAGTETDAHELSAIKNSGQLVADSLAEGLMADWDGFCVLVGEESLVENLSR